MNPYLDLKVISIIILLTMTNQAIADARVSQIPVLDMPTGTVGLGVGFRSGTTPYPGVDNVSSYESEKNSDVVPLYLYEGKYLYAHGTSAGVHLFKNDKFRINMLAQYRFDRLDPRSSDFLEGLDKREQSVDGGFSFSYNANWGQLDSPPSMTC